MRQAVHLLCPSCGQPFEADRVDAVEDILSPTEWRIFEAVQNRPGIGMDALVQAVWGNTPGGGPLTAPRVASVLIFRANKRLEPLGLRIAASHRGIGATYSIRVT